MLFVLRYNLLRSLHPRFELKVGFFYIGYSLDLAFSINSALSKQVETLDTYEKARPIHFPFPFPNLHYAVKL
jgi:hypothetical protein